MAIVEKKCWPDVFAKLQSGEKNCDLRLADFALAPGDTLLFKEFDPATKKFSGRQLEKKCVRAGKINPLDYYKAQDLKKNGCYLIELE